MLATAKPERPDVEWSPDDLYILYTGGTTGMPKGVLWRQADVAVAAFSIKDSSNGREWQSLDDLVEDAADDSTMMRFLPAPPFMHGAGHWNAFSAWGRGAQVVIQGVTERLDADDILRTIERERVRLPADRRRCLRPAAARRARSGRLRPHLAANSCCPAVPPSPRPARPASSSTSPT